MEVIILAGGLGTRLRSEVNDVPKCMATVSGKPFLWYILKQLAKYKDISKVLLSVGYLRNVIFNWVSSVQGEFKFSIEYAIEEEPLGTGGGIRLAMEKVKDSCALIMNGDTYFDVDLEQLFLVHSQNRDSKITIALRHMTNFDRYGAVICNREGRIVNFEEKKLCNSGYINGGIYVLDNDLSIFDNQPQKFSFETEVMMKESGESGCVFGEVYDGYFIDIGIPQDFHRANIEFYNLFE